MNVRTYAKDLRLPAARDFLWQYVHCTPLTAILASLDGDRIAALSVTSSIDGRSGRTLME